MKKNCKRNNNVAKLFFPLHPTFYWWWKRQAWWGTKMVFDKVHILLFIRCRLAFFLIVYFALKTFLKIWKSIYSSLRLLNIWYLKSKVSTKSIWWYPFFWNYWHNHHVELILYSLNFKHFCQYFGLGFPERFKHCVKLIKKVLER